MRCIHMILAAALALQPAALLAIQTRPEVPGHWEGSVQLPSDDELKFAIDVVRSSNGLLSGIFSQGESGSTRRLPISTVTADGAKVRFVLKSGDDPATFDGEVSEDGKSLSGTVVQGPHSLPFSLKRTGDAKVVAVPKSAPIPKELEGTWNASISAGGKTERIVLQMANQADGTAAGTIVDLDGSGVEIPIAMILSGSTLTVDAPTVGVRYVATLNGTKTELAGEWSQSGIVIDALFRRQ